PALQKKRGKPGPFAACPFSVLSVRRATLDHVSIFTYSKSPGLLSMPTFGGEIHGANSPISVTGVISEPMKSPSLDDGSQSSRRLLQVVSSIRIPSGVAFTSLNSPIARWKAVCGRLNL